MSYLISNEFVAIHTYIHTVREQVRVSESSGAHDNLNTHKKCKHFHIGRLDKLNPIQH